MNTNLKHRRLVAFSRDAAERAAKTFAQAVIAKVAVTDGLAIDTYLELETWGVGLAAAILSILSSIASRRVGAPSNASAL